jgi:hypothetical protein
MIAGHDAVRGHFAFDNDVAIDDPKKNFGPKMKPVGADLEGFGAAQKLDQKYIMQRREKKEATEKK